MQLGRFHRQGGRRFGKLKLLREHGSTLKAMSLLGPLAFGPKCSTCGLPDARFMPAQHRAALEAVADQPIDTHPGFCHCPPPPS